MGRIYSVSFAGTVTAAGTDSDLLEIAPADDKPVKLRGWCLGQTSEVGDTAEEGLRISVILLPATFTGGSGGSTITPAPNDTADAAAGCTTKCNNTTVATTSGTAVTRGEFAWNERNSPYDFWYPDVSFAPKVKQGEGMVVRMQTTPADDFSGCFTFWIEEE
jgi:hypothetical protein